MDRWIVKTIAGHGQSNFQDGPDIDNSFYNPSRLCVGKDGKIYVTDRHNHTIKKINQGRITTVAGQPRAGFKDGSSNNALFCYPAGLCISKDDEIYVVDEQNHCVRKIHGHQVTTIAGGNDQGFRDGHASHSLFNYPCSLCISNDKKIYVADTGNNRIRLIENDQVTTIAGKDSFGLLDGNTQHALFNRPSGICISTDGKIYITDLFNHCIRMIDGDQVTTIAGNGRAGFCDGSSSMQCSVGPTVYVYPMMIRFISPILVIVVYENWIGIFK